MTQYVQMAMSESQRCLWNLNLIKNVENTVGLFPWVSPLLLKIKKCKSHFCFETANENKQFKETKRSKSNSNLIRQRFQGYCCKSGIVIFARRVAWNYAYRLKMLLCMKLKISAVSLLISWVKTPEANPYSVLFALNKTVV